ncbi:bacterial Ig-like domain (Group 2) protein [Vibrio variabilis]|uniref:Bacterial Ig-like domain (Group 2) protein n=1 Tax=Vibrio variabilis TaxID=990271 RepID=A0ABQ0JNJ9_9VIBR|nr:bacterial Ig-like domain (Group 2) protein [Vibrio variabilis]
MAKKRFAVYGHYSDGTTQDVSSRAFWGTPNDTSVATSDGSLVTAQGVGVTQFTASFGGFDASSRIVVSDATIEGISVSPSDFNLALGREKQLKVFAHYSNGMTQDVTNASSWRSNASSIADSNGGQVVANNVGSTLITASYMGHEASSEVTVSDIAMIELTVKPKTVLLPNGETRLLQAYALFSDGSELDVTTTAKWGSSDHFKASVIEGYVTAKNTEGTVAITATYDEFSDSSSVAMTDASLSRLSIEPEFVFLGEGDDYQFEVIAHYSDRTSQNITHSVLWTTSDFSLAKVVEGLVTGKGTSGDVDIGAVYGGYETKARIQLTSATVERVEIDPDSISLGAGETYQLQATAFYSNGYSQQVTGTAKWSTSASSIASVQRGVVTGHGNSGTATISATYGKHKDSAMVTITDLAISKVSIEPEEFILGDGDRRQLKAYAHYVDGSSRVINDAALWGSDRPELASVTNGLVTSHATSGIATISVRYLAHEAHSKVNLIDATLEGVSIVPEDVTIGYGDTRLLKLVAHYSDNQVREISADEWHSSNESLVSVENGLITGIGNSGFVTVTAHYGKHTATSKVSLTNAVIRNVVIDPDSLTLRAGDKQRLRLLAFYSDGTNREVYSDAWFSSDGTQVSVADGLVSAHGSHGSVLITANYRSHTATSTVNLTDATLFKIWIDPDVFVLRNGERRKLTAYALYSDGAYQKIIPDSWESSDSTLIDVLEGDVRGHDFSGSATITAKYSGHVATSEGTLTSATVTDVAVLPTQLHWPKVTRNNWKHGLTTLMGQLKISPPQRRGQRVSPL